MAEDAQTGLLNTAPPAGETTPPPAGETTPPPAQPSDGVDFATEGWKDYIPEALKDRNEWTRVNNVQDVFKNYIESQQTISKSVRLPEEGATAEEINAFYAKLGKPADKSEYKFEYKPQEGYPLTQDMYNFESFQEIAEKANLTKSQYQDLASAYMDIQNKMLIDYNTNVSEAAGAEVRQAESELRKEWGKDYASNINNITAKITKMYPEETLKRMENSGLFRDVNFLKSQLSLTKMMTGDTIFIEGTAVEDVPQTIEDLRAKRDALMKEDYLKNKAQVNELNKQIVSLNIASQSQMRRG